MALKLSTTSMKQVGELAAGFGWPSVEDAIERLIATFYAAYRDADPPAGWVLNKDLTLDHLERYFDAYEMEAAGKTAGSRNNVWFERGRTIRAAAASGWITAPEAVTPAMIKGLSPEDSTRLKNAIDVHYTRLTVPDPNSSGPSQTT